MSKTSSDDPTTQNAGPPWQIRFTAGARRMYDQITDRRVREQILRTVRRLEHEPEKQGKPLLGELASYRSLRAVGQRYRILYTLEKRIVTVHIVAVGIRKDGDRNDIYALAQRLFSQGLLAPTKE